MTFGFVHGCYKMLKFKDLQIIPFYLIQFIAKWIRYEKIHLIWMCSEANKHWTIDVDDIIQSKQQQTK